MNTILTTQWKWVFCRRFPYPTASNVTIAENNCNCDLTGKILIDKQAILGMCQLMVSGRNVFNIEVSFT